MKVWIYTTKEIEEYVDLTEKSEIKRSSTDKAKKGDLILIYRGKPYSNIAYIFKAGTDAYEDKYFREGWDIVIDIHDKIEISNPIIIKDMRNDSILGNWSTVRKNFMGSFFEVPAEEWERLKKLILEKNNDLEESISSLKVYNSADENKILKNWTFAMNKSFYFELKDQDEIKWNSPKEVKKGDIIFVYTGAPYSSIGFILKAISDPFEDDEIREERGRPAVMVQKLIEIENPVKLAELKENPILSQWAAIRMNFRGSHFKMSEQESEELKKLIIANNIELKNIIDNLDNGKLGIRYFIKQMLENYIKAKNNPKIAKELVSFANGGDFHEYLVKIANQFEKGDYGTFGLFGASTDLQPIPYVHIYNKKYPTWRIIFLFREDMEGVYLSLGQQPWTMEGKLKEEGLNIQKFSQEFNDYLLNDSIEARTKLKNLTTIPEEYLEKIDLGSKTAISAASREAGNVFAKYYTLENLPSEEELISDFEETLNLYEELSNSIEENSNFDIKSFIDTVLKKYHGVKNEKVKGNPLSNVFNEFAQNLKEFINSEVIETDRYYVKSVHYGQSKFVKGPYVYLMDKKTKNPHYIAYMFREDLQGVYLVLNGSGIKKEFENNEENFDSEEEFEKSFINNLRTKLIKKTKLTERFNTTSEGAWFSSSTIFAKYYEKNSIPSNQELIADLNDILDLYNLLVPYEKLRVISDIKDIKKAQELFKSKFVDISDQIIEASTQSSKLPLLWSSKLNIWGYFGDVDNHYFNPFGIGKPDLNTDNQTICEINSPHEGINRNSSGVFASDNYGKLFLLNRGKFHGKKIQKEEYSGEWVEVVDGDQENELILIGALDEPDFPEKLKDFVFEVCKIKKGAECVKNQDFFDYLSEKGYLFDQKLVENFLLSLKVKPFVILTGNSGTGKTKVAQLFAEYLAQILESQTQKRDSGDIIKVDISTKTKKNRGGWELKDDELNKLKDNSDNLTLEVHWGRSNIPKKGKGYIKNNKLYYAEKTPFSQEMEGIIVGSRAKIKLISKEYVKSPDISKIHEIIPVGANWTENRHVMGFYNVITEKYQKTKALDLILKSAPESNDLQPHFLILDEMNLSHVERYFSDFLSAMESQEEMPLHNNHDKVVPQKLKLPDNLLVIGTVNMDETTYMFSPKVLDRANTIEFLTLEPLDYMQNTFNTTKPTGDLDYLQDTLSDIDIRISSIENLKSLMANIKTTDNKPLWDVVSEEINKIYRELKKAGFDFGFRVINEIMRFIYVAWKYEREPLKWDNWERYFDAQIKQKMLPKLHGSQRTLQEVINNLFVICYGRKNDRSPRWLSEKELINAKYPTAALKLSEMDKVLYEQRYVAFIN